MMIEPFFNNLHDFIQNIRLVDLFDVGLVTIFLYLFLNWLLKTISRRSILGFSVLVGIYIVARLTGMYLTELLIQVLLIIIPIGMIIVFQSDIRRLVDRIGDWSIFGKQEAHSSNLIADIIAEATSKMAETRTGALIVLKGREDWDRHIHGGISLNGKISIPLLHSIFNTKAPGHDGAILLEGDTILRFGTHLPLSTNLGKSSAGGTRHAAALGLSEQCDALVVVVSEERGIISTARSGRLTELQSAGDLKKIISDYCEEYYSNDEASPLAWWRQRNLKIVFASLVIAIALWLGFAYQSGTVYRTFAVPIEYRNLQASNIVLQDSMPVEANVTLSGSDQAFRSLDPAQLIISFNMTSQRLTSDRLPITKKNMNLPNGLKLYEVSPPSLPIRQIQSKKLPVKVLTKGHLPKSLTLRSIRPLPPGISVHINSSATDIPDSISTEPLDLSKVTRPDTLSLSLKFPSQVKPASNKTKNIFVIVNVYHSTQ